MAKKYKSAYDGVPIKIKRTTLSLDETAGKEAIDNDGVLHFGEPIYLQYTVTENNQMAKDSYTHEAKYLAIGEGTDEPTYGGVEDSNVTTSTLKVFKALPRDLVEGTFFYKQNTRAISKDAANTSGDRVDFVDQEGNNIYPKLRRFTIHTTDNIPVDKNGTIIQMSAAGTWYKVNLDGSISETVASATDFPRAQYINIPDITADTIPYVCLAVSNNSLQDYATIKVEQKAFGCITKVVSFDSKIAVFCGNKAPTHDCYLDVFGG